MARPLRIEFEGAWYHVMNRGAARQPIFAVDDHRYRFLELLGELSTRFEIETHAYCLMGNHYHLLLHTPRANLGRGLRHLNGVYTQYFNRDQHRDGPLFRGRYKAILVDADAYLLQLSRYIHRNPIEAGVVPQLNTFRWSSYPAYIGRGEPDPWLFQDMIHSLVDGNARRYRSYVEKALDEDLEQFYGKQYLSPILGDSSFKQFVIEHYVDQDPEIPELARLRQKPSVDKIIEVVTAHLGCRRQRVYESTRGQRNLARMLVADLAASIGHLTHREIASLLGMGHYSSVSSSLRRLKQLRADDEQVDELYSAVMQKIAKDAT